GLRGRAGIVLCRQGAAVRGYPQEHRCLFRPVEAAGILRARSQGSTALFRNVPRLATLRTELVMSKILLIIGGLIVVGIAGVLIVAATKSDTFRIQRSLAIAAPADKIFPYLNEFQRWTAWSPYEHKDPDMKRSFSGPATGPGAIYEWEGDKNVGAGRIEI